MKFVPGSTGFWLVVCVIAVGLLTLILGDRRPDKGLDRHILCRHRRQRHER